MISLPNSITQSAKHPGPLSVVPDCSQSACATLFNMLQKRI